MQLSNLWSIVAEYDDTPCPDNLDNNLDNNIQNITDDTRNLKAGDILVWDDRIAPKKTAYVLEQAVAKNAAYIITNAQPTQTAQNFLFHPNPGLFLASWAQHKFPQIPPKLLAITGTNGKTSVAWFVNQILSATGHKSASIGTLGIYKGAEFVEDLGYTSPTALTLHKTLQTLAQQGITHCVMEASSHGLALQRLHGLRFNGVGLTNISQDHLDFHGTMDDYIQAKQILFSHLMTEDGTAVVHIQHPQNWPFASVAKQNDHQVLTVGSAQAELVVNTTQADRSGLTLNIKYNTINSTVHVPLLGELQAQNIAVALGLCHAAGANLQDCINALPTLKSVPGRLELLPQTPSKPTVVVDYAHTPDALAKVLQAVRPVVPQNGQLWVVFGAGGDRDTSKRPFMGKAATDYADQVIITDDNPRTEDPSQIRHHVAQGAPQAQMVDNRAQAIRKAIELATEDDIVVLAGKGHENYQVIGTEKIHFSDKEEALKVLNN